MINEPGTCRGLHYQAAVGLALISLLVSCNAATQESTMPPAGNPREATSPDVIVTDPESADMRILFLGNSHTSRIPEQVQQLLQIADNPVSAYCDMRFGMFLESIAGNESARELIKSGKWDVVVLQGQKISMSGKYHYPVEQAIELSKLASAAGARVLLYSEWGRLGVAGETERTQKIYQSIADESDAVVAPVGAAWERSFLEEPDRKLHAADGNHSNHRGKFLTACVLYGCITGRPVADLPVLKNTQVTSEEQKSFQALADATLDEHGGRPERTGETDAAANCDDSNRWYRGNLHTHSLWSDGDDFPEMISRWYAEHGYQFLAMTDHNILARGERWMDESKIEGRGGQECLDKYRAVFGDCLVKTREQNGQTQFRLTPLAEYRGLFEKPGEFLLIEGEEVSDAVEGIPVHINATNLKQILQPTGGATVREAIDNNLRVAAEQSKRTGQQILMHLNHPNYGWAITAEDLAAVTRARFFEAYNGHNGVNHLGDAMHPPVERLWDIANTLRIDKLNAPPLYGIACDDSHYYHGRPGSHPGRGWVMVRSAELQADALLNAMQRGEFYASSGVTLANVEFDPVQRELRLAIEGAEGVDYQTEFIGTRRGYNEQAEPREMPDCDPSRVTREYSEEVGEVLASDDSLNPAYKFAGDELYVRAVVTSSRAHPDPSFTDQTEQAWTQPVGWQQ